MNQLATASWILHDAVAVHLFQQHLVDILKTNYNVTKMIYFSDRWIIRKNFINLCHHYEEWHFFAISHGKGSRDGVGKL